MDGPANLVEVKNLSDQNYNTWKQKIMLPLAFGDLHICVEDETTKNQIQQNQKECKPEDRKACVVIEISLSDEPSACEGC